MASIEERKRADGTTAYTQCGKYIFGVVATFQSITTGHRLFDRPHKRATLSDVPHRPAQIIMRI